MNFFESYQIAREYRSDPLAFITKMKKQNGHRTKLNVFGKDLFIFSNPSDITHVLKDHHTYYEKGTTTKVISVFLGNGILNSEGDFWRKQHRLIRPLMNWKGVYEMAPLIHQTTRDYISSLDSTKEVNALTEMNRLTWRIVLKTLFSQEASVEMDAWLEDILFLMEFVAHRTRTPIQIPYWVPSGRNLRMKASVKKLDDYVYGLIHERRASSEKKKDLLQLLIDARDGEESRMSDKEVKDELLTFLITGHETVTNSMSWTLIMLAQYPQYQERLREEAKSFEGHQDFEALQNMPWHEAVLNEVMRVWPPIWVYMREAIKEDRIGDYVIPVKANVVVAPFLTHRSEDLWENPLEFRPERFLGEEKKKISPGAFFPFGIGPRACIGMYFANIETKIILSELVKNFDWELRGPVAPQKGVPGLTLRPDNNLLMNFRRRG